MEYLKIRNAFNFLLLDQLENNYQITLQLIK